MWMVLGCLTLPSERAYLWEAAADLDQDGHGAERYGGGDCDDNDASVFPGAAEIPYNQVDDDCDPLTLDDDLDQDGVAGDVDCDDEDPETGAPTMLYVDLDADGYGTTELGVDCPGGAVAVLGDDCDDEDPAVNPGELEVCENGVDDNCSGADDCRLLGDVGFGDHVWVDGSGDQRLTLHSADGLVVAHGLEGGPAQFWLSDASRPDGTLSVQGGTAPDAVSVDQGSTQLNLVVGQADAVGLISEPRGDLRELADFDAWVSGAKDVRHLAVGDMRGHGYSWIAVDTGPSIEVLGLEDDPMEGGLDIKQATQASVRLGDGPIWIADLAGDGVGQLLTSPTDDGVGALYIFESPLPAVSTRTDAAHILTGESQGDRYSQAGVMQDLDGDGYNDLIVGSPSADTFSADGGLVQVFPGPITDSVPDPIAQIHTVADANLGDTLSFCGDVDWDDHADLLVGMPGLNGGDGGAVLLYGPFEGAMHVDDLPNFQVLGATGQGVGPVACPGDLDGDDIPDLVVGATNLLSGMSPELALISGQAQ